MVGVWMILQTATYINGVAEPNLSHYALGALAAASGVLLLLGFLTPIASIMANRVESESLMAHPDYNRNI